MGARILAFDTSTPALHIGVCAPGRRLTRSLAGAAPASAHLVPHALQLLTEAGISMHQLDAIAFGRGPGAFTGLRTACAVAQGFALGAGKPVLAIDSLMITAQDVRAHAGDRFDDLWIVADARMDEIYLAHYRAVAGQAAGNGRWRAVLAPALYTLAAVHRLWEDEGPRDVAGSALAAFGPRLSTGSARRHADGVDPAEALLRLAECAFEDGAGVDAALALPDYVRDKVALTTAERLAQSAVDRVGRR